MIGKGQHFSQTTALPAPPEIVMRDLVAAVSGVSGYTVVTNGQGQIVLTRKFWPTWVIAGAVIGALFFLLGLLLLFIRQTETLTITLQPIQGGTGVRINGDASGELSSRVSMYLTSAATPSSFGQQPQAFATTSPLSPQEQTGQSDPSMSQSVVARLGDLKRLHDSGTISDAEYAEQRQRLVAQL